jgi:uncharacterized membrane protein YphA (DoxX/SURF4 family)
MKLSVTIARIIVGVLFIFSGLVKAMDPLGLTYKMQEFFEVWGREGYATIVMNWMYGHTFLFSIIMITLEVVLGVALLTGFRKKLVLRALLVLMLFFTFLTSYVLFSGKIATCGCFGDCIPLTPIQTFTKDIILLLLIIFLMLRQQYLQPLGKEMFPLMVLLLSIMGVTLLQMHVIKHLPLIDCLPYKKGNDLLLLRQMPANAIPDKFEYSFVYEKNGEKKSFNANQLPDSTWSYVDRKQTLVQKGSNNVPLINDFSLTDSAGVDVTETSLSQSGLYYLFFIKDFEGSTGNWSSAFARLWQKAKEQSRPLYIVTADKEKATEFFNKRNSYKVTVYTCDATAIKTAARANPTLFLMKGAVVQNKWSWADIDQAISN